MATVVIVAFNTTHLDLRWVPDEAQVVVVHNDNTLADESVDHPGAEHLHPGRNLGFGGGVNPALPKVRHRRVILANPDLTGLTMEHWDALAEGAPDEVRTVPVALPSGVATSVANRYPTAISHLLTTYRTGRLAPLGTRRRMLLSRLIPGWGDDHVEGLTTAEGTWPLSTHWVSGALLSIDVDRLRAVGGFDEAYFLYFEDVDLSERLGRAHPGMAIRMCPTTPVKHAVGGSAASGAHARTVDRLRRRSAQRWARSRRGLPWRVVGAVSGHRRSTG